MFSSKSGNMLWSMDFFFGQPVKTAVWTYDDIRKVMTGKYEYTLGFVPDYLYSNVRLIG